MHLQKFLSGVGHTATRSHKQTVEFNGKVGTLSASLSVSLSACLSASLSAGLSASLCTVCTLSASLAASLFKPRRNQVTRFMRVLNALTVSSTQHPHGSFHLNSMWGEQAG